MPTVAWVETKSEPELKSQRGFVLDSPAIRFYTIARPSVCSTLVTSKQTRIQKANNSVQGRSHSSLLQSIIYIVHFAHLCRRGEYPAHSPDSQSTTSGTTTRKNSSPSLAPRTQTFRPKNFCSGSSNMTPPCDSPPLVGIHRPFVAEIFLGNSLAHPFLSQPQTPGMDMPIKRHVDLARLSLPKTKTED